MTVPKVVERVVDGGLFARPPVPGDYYFSQTGRSVIAVNRVRKMVGERAGVRYRLFGMRVRLKGLPPGIIPLPWPSKPVIHPPLPTVEAFIGPPPPPPNYRLARATERFQARKRVVGLLLDDRDTERLVDPIRLANGTVEKGDWRDPDDMSVVKRTARVIHGVRARDVIESLLASGTLNKRTARVARRFRRLYELGVVGMRAPKSLSDTPSGFFPSGGPSESRLAHLSEYNSVIASVGPHLSRIVVAILVHEQTIQSYAGHNRLNRAATAGYFQAAVDAVADWFEKLDDEKKDAALPA